MIRAQSGLQRFAIPRRGGVSLPLDRQPITLGMRLGHRLAAYVNGAPRLLRNPGPLVSFSFDDVPDSAVRMGAALLEEFGARGTFFVSTSLLDQRTLDWRVTGPEGVERLAEAGHEIGLHTHSHQPLANLSRRALAEDLERCHRSVERMAPNGASANFAYPFGFAHPLHIGCLNRLARSSRTTHPGINAGRADLHYLKSYAFGSSLYEPAAIDRLLDQTVACGGWLILTGHDVTDRPSAYGCTPALLAHALCGAEIRGITVAPIEAALDACGVEPLAARLKGSRP